MSGSRVKSESAAQQVILKVRNLHHEEYGGLGPVQGLYSFPGLKIKGKFYFNLFNIPRRVYFTYTHTSNLFKHVTAATFNPGNPG